MSQRQHVAFIKWRFYLILLFIALAVLGLAWRIFDLAVLDQRFLRAQGDERVLRLVSSPSFRGMIVDRQHFPLAVSTTVYSIWMNPKEFDAKKQDIKALARLLDMKVNAITSLSHRYQKMNREFLYLKRGFAPDIASQIKALNIPGIYLQQEYRRYYPEGEITAHVVGFTNIDDHGQEGLELGYDNWLMGEPGKKWVIKDRLGRAIADVQTVSEEQRGRDLVLSIDRRLQYLAYRELIMGIKENEAQSGSVVVLDVKTGEVLAMANFPSFNPNNRPARRGDQFRNRAITDTFEPGSTIKAFTVASALETGRVKSNAVIDTSPGWMRVGKNVVRDEHNNGKLSLSEILQISSNMGAAKLVLSLPPNQLWSLLHRVGFGEVTGIGFPGEQGGALVQRQPWGAFTLATLSFGYGLSTTALQLARAYAVLANGGVKLPVSLLRVDTPPVGERVFDTSLSQQMLSLLETVVLEGTGKPAQVPGYRVAGKTGTTQMLGEDGYQKHKHSSSFVGIAPVTDPRLVVAVVIHNPQGKHYHGGTVSAPVFEKIMEGALRILDVPPDVPLASS